MPKYLSIIIYFFLLSSCSAQKENPSLEEKLKELNIRVANNPKDADLRWQRAYLFDSLNLPLKSLEDINFFIGKNPKNTAAYFLRAKLKMALDDDSGAINDFNKIIYLDNKNAEAHYQRGLIRSKYKDITGACIDMKKAVVYGQHKQARIFVEKHCPTK